MVRYHCRAVDVIVASGGDKLRENEIRAFSFPAPKTTSDVQFWFLLFVEGEELLFTCSLDWTIQIKGDSTAQGITVQSLFIVTTTPCDVKDECQSRLPHASIPLNNYTTTTPLNSLHSAVYCCVAATDFSIPAVISKTSSGSGGNDAVIVPSSFK